MNRIKMKLQYDSWFVVDPIGRASGLSVMWRKEMVIRKVLYTDFTIELQVAGKGNEAD